MSADTDVHARCICEDPNDPDNVDHFGQPWWTGVDTLVNALATDFATDKDTCTLSDVADEVDDLVRRILAEPTPHARHRAMVAVIGSLLDLTVRAFSGYVKTTTPE